MEKIFHPANSRGTANFGWLNANYSFSFANYFDPKRLQFGKLRVLNDDIVKGGMGFGTHPHQNMEIITIPLKGELKHKDSMNHSAVIKAGEVQVMSAGTGVEHSEVNPSKEDLNLLQIWIFPEKEGLEPRYDQKDFSKMLTSNKLLTVVSPRSQEDNTALWINQQAYLHLGEFEENTSTNYAIKNSSMGVYIFLIEGEAEVADTRLEKRDAIGIWNSAEISISFVKPSKVLLIEVPMN